MMRRLASLAAYVLRKARKMNVLEAVPSSDLRLFASHFTTGVSVVTTRERSGMCRGITLNAVTSLSLDPPLYLICLHNRSNTLPAIRDSGSFCLHFLAADQAELSSIFASKQDDKFSTVDYRIGSSGSPILEGVLAASECRVTEMMPGGDHTIVIGIVERVHVSGGDPLLYHRGAYANLERPARRRENMAQQQRSS